MPEEIGDGSVGNDLKQFSIEELEHLLEGNSDSEERAHILEVLVARYKEQLYRLAKQPPNSPAWLQAAADLARAIESLRRRGEQKISDFAGKTRKKMKELPEKWFGQRND